MDSVQFWMAALALLVAGWAAWATHNQADKVGEANSIAREALGEAKEANRIATKSHELGAQDSVQKERMAKQARVIVFRDDGRSQGAIARGSTRLVVKNIGNAPANEIRLLQSGVDVKDVVLVFEGSGVDVPGRLLPNQSTFVDTVGGPHHGGRVEIMTFWRDPSIDGEEGERFWIDWVDLDGSGT